MKVKHLWVSLIALAFFGCDDNTGSMGLGLLPESDLITVGTKTFSVETKSVLSGPVFAKTSIGYLGKFTDDNFGYYETSFLTELNCTDSLRFPPLYVKGNGEKDDIRMAGDSTLLTELILSYPKGSNGYFGDSLNACRLNVYELTTPLNKKSAYYTDIDPESHYNESDLLGRKAYSAVDLSLSDSLRNTMSNYFIRVNLSREYGERILKLNRERPDFFYDADKFIEYVTNGLYVKNEYGDGTILYIDQVQMNVAYNCVKLDENGNAIQLAKGGDSIFTDAKSFAATKEIIQANRFLNSDKMQIKANETDWTFLKSPAGIFTEATLPIQNIYNELKKDTLSAVKLVFNGYNQKNAGIFTMSPPTNVLLVRADERNSFFENNKLADQITSYRTTYASNQYTFNNITRLINACIGDKEAAKKTAGSAWDEAKWEEENPNWNKVLLIPIEMRTVSNSNNTSTVISIHNSMRPEYVKLKGGEADTLSLKVDYIRFKDEN